ncbi:uncharacterized protein LOC116306515 [Actinia tenebrosa]|uniref:Uncharacterized protein LOC116306515 n=1 Tax=Actinia tenebrosa TaxID=6105 RepID=A0A6P8IYA1_ACTTE|nr:uncharacterized protein LOC116306515 [Actinia tenebrosa]
MESKEQEQRDVTTFSDLPEEIWLHVFSFLPVSDIFTIGCTCHRLFYLTNQDVVWKRRFRSNNDHLLTLPSGNNNNYHSSSKNNNIRKGIWKKLYLKASYAMSFGLRKANKDGQRLCAEFVRRTSGSGIRFDSEAPESMSVELWIKLHKKKPDGIILGCQSESMSSARWATYHWQLLHIGPDRCIRGSLEPYKFMKGPRLDDEWHHVAITASSDSQTLLVDGVIVDTINFGIGHEYHRHFMRYCQLGNGIISYGDLTPWTSEAMPSNHCDWYPFFGLVRELRIWSGKLPDSSVQHNMYKHRVDLLSHDHNCVLIGYWPFNRLASGPWPWQGSLVSCKSHLEEPKENMSHLRTVCSALP